MSITTRIVAHRGASHAAPENTLAAFALALDEGADGIEFDVRLAGDGQPHVFHDEDTERLCGVAGRFDARTSDEVAALRVRGESIPTLAASVRAITRHAASRGAANPWLVNVELKTCSNPATLLRNVRPYLAALHGTPGVELVVSSFDPRLLKPQTDPQVPWGVAYIYDTPLALTALPHLPGVDLHPRHDLLDSAALAEYDTPGRCFRSWTVDDPLVAKRLIALQVDSIITNRPGELRAALASL